MILICINLISAKITGNQSLFAQIYVTFHGNEMENHFKRDAWIMWVWKIASMWVPIEVFLHL